jgi:hypothetical protein
VALASIPADAASGALIVGDRVVVAACRDPGKDVVDVEKI